MIDLKCDIIERATCSYKNDSTKFRFKAKRKFDLQYFHLYTIRLAAMKSRITNTARRAWGEDIKIMDLSDVEEDVDCVVIGILFRKMELQPSILKEISLEEGVLPLPPQDKYASTGDQLFLEGQQQRILLTGHIDVDASVTGTVLAVQGKEIAGGKFYVEKYCFCGLPCQPHPNLDGCLQAGEDRFVVLVSGLGIGSKNADQMRLQMFVDLVTGQLGCEQDKQLFSKVCRVIIAGNCLSVNTQDEDSEKVAKYLTKHMQAKSVEPIKVLDELLIQLGSSVNVDVMPGEYDPSNQFLPQQPLHRCMFPRAFDYSTIESHTNPYSALVGGVRLLGTSGQNVDNIFQYSCMEDRIAILESTLRSAHISPTSPDTLSCYPYYKEDPFVIDKCPDVYFAGNQPFFQTKVIKGESDQSVLLVCVPTFESTGCAVFVNLRDRTTFPFLLSTSMQDKSHTL